MIKSRTIVVSLAALAVTACADIVRHDSAATRLDTAPLVTYSSPPKSNTLSKQAVAQAAELASADRHIDAATLEKTDDETTPATSARSSISLL